MHSILIGLGKVAYSLVIFALTVFAARFFPVAGYGLFREFYLYFIIGISVSGIPAVNAVYYFHKRNQQNMLILFLMSFAVALAVLLIIYIISSGDFTIAVIVALPGSIMYLLLDALLISGQKFIRAFIITIIESLTFLVPIPLLIFNDWGFYYYIVIFACIGIIKLFVYSVIIMIESRHEKGHSTLNMIKYLAPVYVNNLVGIVSGKIDKYIVSAMFGPVMFAFYSSGAFEIPLIGRFINGVFHSKASLIRQGLIEKEYALIRGSLLSLLLYIFPIIGSAALLFAINARYVITALYSPVYQDAYLFFLIYLLVLPFRLVPLGFFMNLSGKTRQLMYLGIADAALTVLLSVFLIHIIGPIGGAFAFIIATLFQIILITLYIRDFFPVRFYYMQNIIILVFVNIGIFINLSHSYSILTNLILLPYLLIEFILILWSRK